MKKSLPQKQNVDMDDSEHDEEDNSDRNMTKDVFTPENNAILEITSSARVDESISHVEFHAHLPLASATFNSNDEIRIAVNQQDLCVVPSQSGLHIAGRLPKLMVRLLKQPNSSTTLSASSLKNCAMNLTVSKLTDVATSV